MTVTNSNIIKLAKSYKTYIEKNKKTPSSITLDGTKYTYKQCAYLFAKAVKNPKVNVKLISIAKQTKSSGDTINEKVKKADYVDMATRVVSYIDKNNQLPNNVTTKTSKKKVKTGLYIYGFAKIVAFYGSNKRLPNTCLFNSNDFKSSTSSNTSSKTTNNCQNPYTSSPHFLETGCNKLGQCNSFFCGPHCLRQSLKKFGITKYTEAQLAKWAGTTTSGSSHEGLETAIAKVAKLEGIKLKVEWKYFSDFGKTNAERFKAIGKLLCQSNKAVFTHIGYQGSGSSASGVVFGHYEMFDKVNTVDKTVRALNSLGNKCNAPAYCGHTQIRSFDLEAHYINNKSGVKSICIITKG